MCKHLIALTLLLLVVGHQQVSSAASPLPVFRSSDIQLNPSSRKDWSVAPFAASGQRVEADLAGEPNEESDQHETYPIDFTRIDLSKHSPTGRGVLNSMQNDEIRPAIGNGRHSSGRYGAHSAKLTRSSARETPSKFDRIPVLDYDRYCSPSNYLAECLRRKFSKRNTSKRVRKSLENIDTDSLSPLMSDCIVLYQKNCEQISKQPLFH